MGNKREIAESRIPDLNTYMKVITSHFNARCRLFFAFLFRAEVAELLACWLGFLLQRRDAGAYNSVG